MSGESETGMCSTGPDVACPLCGYMIEDVKNHGDHRRCKGYPYFPHEIDQKNHNDWVEDLKSDSDFEPLRDFIDRIKE